MRYIHRSVLFFLFFIFISSSSYAQSLDELISKLPNQEALWSVTIRAEDGSILESLNSKKLIVPASNQKLYTTAAVLDRLGSDFKYTTNIYSKGELVDSTWMGRLVISGSGDPTISGFLYNNDREFVFKSFLKQFRAKGIATINGELMAETSYFDQDVYPKGWDWYDLNFYYGVQINALSFNNNAFDLEVFANGNVGDTPRIDWYPKIDAIEIVNNQTIVEPGKKYDEYYRREMGRNHFTLASDLPQGYYETEALSIDGGDLFFLESFENFLVNNEARTKKQEIFASQTNPEDYSNYQILATQSSKPLAELIKWANKESDNFYVEMLLKTLAAEKKGIPGSFDNGISEVRSFLAEQKLDTNFVLMNDGSGLAAGNFTTTANISQLLSSMQKHKEFEVYYNSLPIAGIDGSLSYRFKTSPLANNLRGKTGYVGGMRTLAGYFVSKSGKMITYSVATNNFTGKVSVVDASHQQILEYLYAKY
tara:strand:+ start:1259 stop:2698 length:1440 start_codon:yes stop_codon:yes gene_type:complete